MNLQQFFDSIEKHIELADSEKELIWDAITVKEFDKKELILRQGYTCKKIYFVESGSLRAYNINEQGKESTIMFAFQDWWITDMYAFTNQVPALFSIQTLQASKLVVIEYHQLEHLYKQIPKLERFFRILFQNAYVREQLRALDNISIPSEQRYTRFIEKYPHITTQVTQKQIASYLGITPQFLSSIKKNK